MILFYLYTTILTLFLLFYIPFLFLKGLFQKPSRELLKERLAFFPRISFSKAIWIHGASMGEVLCTSPLIRKIKEEFPDYGIILTTMTKAGKETARNSLSGLDRILYFPFDHPLLLKRAFRNLSPNLILVAETELWPNLLRLCGQKEIPLLLFNGRISQHSFKRYRFLKPLFKAPLQSVSLFLLQTEEDRRRILRMGAPFEKTVVTGNLKFDQDSFLREERKEKNNGLSFLKSVPLLIGGSTHAGEEEILLRLLRRLKKNYPSLHLLLAPRHLDRLDEVERILKGEGFSWLRKTSLTGRTGEGKWDIILLDTHGELKTLYQFGTLIFIGGSLVPIGGHNPLEPLFFKKCVLFGPYMFNFLEISQGLVEFGGALQVKNEEELSHQVERLLREEDTRKEIGEKGYQFIQMHRGATEKTMSAIRSYLYKE
ncbi:MAG: 3-deoxy-D-manno-octulosonic acid transferase [Thermodesulfobacteriota bacterium]